MKSVILVLNNFKFLQFLSDIESKTSKVNVQNGFSVSQTKDFSSHDGAELSCRPEYNMLFPNEGVHILLSIPRLLVNK
jgi:hypothetical protein